MQQHCVLCEVFLNGEDLSHYSNKIASVGLRKCPYYHYLTITITNILQSLPHIMAEKQLSELWYEEFMSLSPYV